MSQARDVISDGHYPSASGEGAPSKGGAYALSRCYAVARGATSLKQRWRKEYTKADNRETNVRGRTNQNQQTRVDELLSGKTIDCE